MKKEVILYLYLVFFILLINPIFSITTEAVTGETITADAANVIGVNITITAPPELIIISPENKTYITNNSLLINYSASSDAETIWYSINSGLNNYTLTSFTYFNTSEGSQTIYMYANNTYGETSKNITFEVNLTLFTVIYDEYNGTIKGSSTDFITYAYEDLQNLSSIILENLENGKILFNNAINTTDDANFSDKTLDLDTYTNISFNRTELNSTALPNFNKSATLWLYNLTFSNPRILRDGDVCPSTICTQESYTGGILKTLKFNVTGFDGIVVYSAEQTPTEAPPPAPSVGVGGGTIKKGFSTDKEHISISLKQGESKEEIIVIRNIGDTPLKINLESLGLENFLAINETNFSLGPKRSRTIILNFSVSENTIPNLYMGKIIIRGDGIEKELPISIEVESTEALFDMKISIPKKYQYVMPGEEIIPEIEIYNIGKVEREVNALIEYKIMDWKGDEILKENETIRILAKKSFTKKFKIPEYVEFGKYVLYARIIYNEKVGSSSAWFNVGKRPTIPLRSALIALIIILLIAIVIIIIKIKEIKKNLKNLYKVNKSIIKSVMEKIKIIKR